MIWPPVLAAAVAAAAVAAAAALVGYWLTYVSKRSDSKAETYARALAAVEAYKQLPYRICRRGESTPEVRGNLGKAIGDVQQDLAFYRRFLRLDSEAALILCPATEDDRPCPLPLRTWLTGVTVTSSGWERRTGQRPWYPWPHAVPAMTDNTDLI